MVTTNFVDKVTLIEAAWLNEVDAIVHDVLDASTTKAEARTALDVAAMGLEFISSADISNVATVDFTGFDATRYDAYLFVLSNVVPVNDGVVLYLRSSTDGGTGYDAGASDYIINNLIRDNADAADVLSTGGFTLSRMELTAGNTIGSAAGEDGWSGNIWVQGPHLLKDTTFRWEGLYRDANGNITFITGGGIRDSSADVDAVQFLMSAANLESGTITMYGMRSS